MGYVMHASLQQRQCQGILEQRDKVSRVRWGNWLISLCSCVEEDQQPDREKGRKVKAEDH